MLAGIWNKQGVVIPPIPSDNFGGGVLFGGTSNICTLYAPNPQLISSNPDGNVFKAWFQGADNLCYAESNDGINWTRRATALMTNVGLPEIWLDSGIYYLYGTVNPQTLNFGAISAWTSTDGINFTLQSSSALVTGTWDAAGVTYLSPFYKDNSNVYHATYSTTITGVSNTGIATSTDLIHWTNGAGSIASNFGGPNAKVIEGNFCIWGGSQTIGRAPLTFIQSTDLTVWTSPTVILPNTIPAEGALLGEGMGPASVLEANGKSYLFYTGTDTAAGDRYQIFVAIANEPLSSVIAGPQGMQVALTKLGEDTFQRPNEAPLSDGGNWLQGNQGAQTNLVSHLAVSTSNANASRAYWTPTFPDDQYSQIILASDFNSGSIVGVDVRNPAGASNTQYEFFVQPTSWTLRSIVNGSAATIASGSGSFAAGDVITIAIITQTIFCFQNTTQITVQTDTPGLTSGNAAIIIFDGTPGNTGITDWQGGEAASPSTVSGTITLQSQSFSGVGISWTGTSSGSTETDGSGTYQIIGLANGSYTITPSLAGYVFSPLSQNVIVNGSNVTGINFTAQVFGNFLLSGNVGVQSQPLSNVTISWAGPATSSTVTDQFGNWTAINLMAGSYYLVPSANGYVFQPTSVTKTISNQSIVGINFLAIPTQTEGTVGKEIHIEYTGSPTLVQSDINSPDNRNGSSTIQTTNENLPLTVTPPVGIPQPGKFGTVHGRFDTFTVINNPDRILKPFNN